MTYDIFDWGKAIVHYPDNSTRTLFSLSLISLS